MTTIVTVLPLNRGSPEDTVHVRLQTPAEPNAVIGSDCAMVFPTSRERADDAAQRPEFDEEQDTCSGANGFDDARNFTTEDKLPPPVPNITNPSALASNS